MESLPGVSASGNDNTRQQHSTSCLQFPRSACLRQARVLITGPSTPPSLPLAPPPPGHSYPSVACHRRTTHRTLHQEDSDEKDEATAIMGIGIAAAAGVCLFSLVAWIGRALWCPTGRNAVDTRPVQYKRRPPPDGGEMKLDHGSFVEVMDLPPVPSAPVVSSPPQRSAVGTP